MWLEEAQVAQKIFYFVNDFEEPIILQSFQEVLGYIDIFPPKCRTSY